MKQWSAIREIPHLTRGVAHVWRVPLDRVPPLLATASAVLSPDESARAARFYFPADRQRFIRCRSALRVLLARYLVTDPAQIEFRYNHFGKPALAVPPPRRPLQFNVSHAGEWALVALTLEHPIGVDVEQIRPIEDLDRLAQNNFSKQEIQAYQGLPSEQRQDVFFHIWTRKEAFIKACGEGLSRPLDQFDVTVAPQDRVRLVRIQEDPTAARRWSLADLEPATGYVGAIAVEFPNARIECFDA